ncbi:MAG: hypothetical protein ACYSO4_04900 [Planctomycetota bacterium]
MKSTAFKNGSNRFAISIVAICLSLTAYGDIEFDGGVSAEIDYRVDGWVWIYDANVIMLEPARFGIGFGCLRRPDRFYAADLHE